MCVGREYTQDELVQLHSASVHTHYLVFWSPGDQLLGPPTHTAKFGAVFGDRGQSEEFSGATGERDDGSVGIAGAR